MVSTLYDLLRAWKGLIWDGRHGQVKSTVYNTDCIAIRQQLYLSVRAHYKHQIESSGCIVVTVHHSTTQQSTSVSCNKHNNKSFQTYTHNKNNIDSSTKKKQYQHSQTLVCQPSQLLSLNNNCLQIPRHISIISSFCLSIFMIT